MLPRSLALLTLFSTLGATAHTQTPSIDTIVARYASARGGIARLRSIHSVIYRGEYREGSTVIPNAAVGLMSPYYKLVGDPEHPSRTFAEGYDGSAWEFYGDPGVVIRTVGAASAAGRHATTVGGPLLDYAARGWTIGVTGLDTVDGRPAYRVLLRMSDGYQQEELIDTTTYLIVAERKLMPIHAFGAGVRTEERLGDYRPVDGVLFPFSHREIDIGTGREMNAMRWTSIAVNHALDAAAFSPPNYVRSPLQSLLEHLYDERSDTNAVQWSYREFRRAHPEIDTDGGVGFIGYQMLKMGDVGGAVALLALNVADYPNSATAAFALGRAYRTAGDSVRAHGELERAHRLDSRYAVP